MAPLWHEIKRFVTLVWANVITTAWRGVRNGTLSRMFTCCPNLMFLASLWLEIHRFSNWSFCYFVQFKVDIHFANIGQVRIDPICFLLLTLDRLQLKMLQVAGREKQSNENSTTMHRIWHKLFLVIQSAGIKNWCLPPTNRLLKVQSLISLYDTFFWFLQQNKMCMIRKNTQKVLENWWIIF